ncbi:hypothetical protein LSUE1_G008130 [Lachnellula suecica]|uniref:Uncharacterized protein n=1 Tax=Lachnellula suecica TaxID=602035 RepID=A0A8T9BYW3_9HELO|nr:hypothetical protein LSUE1_G008130 [Lachnellula suecica]
MSSPSSFEESTPVERPSTPQNQDIDLPARQDLHRSASPATSMMAAPPTSSILSSSMTPPPSSQHPNSRNAARCSVTPDASVLSSPPPTVNGARRDASVTLAKLNAEQITNAAPEELREMLKAALSENSKLDIAAREARMLAAHYKLQHTLLTIESEEAVKHLEVEHDMTLREVELLQVRIRDTQEPPQLEMYKNRCQKLAEDMDKMSEQLRRAKRLILSKDDDISDLQMDVKQLRERIRQNRKHINELRSPGGPLHIVSLQSSPVTPQQYRSTPKHTPLTNRSMRQARDHSQEPFAALLLADRVLSQENNSAPSTPIIGRRPDPRTPNRHNRGVQSLSSLPNTPQSGRPGTANSTLLPSAVFSPQADSRVSTTLGHAVLQQPRERRRKSRDSTISASDTEEIARAAAEYREESQGIAESQASQSATEMLRLDPRESFEVAASRTTTPTPITDKNLQQSKIYGGLTKPVPEKRKRTDEEYNREYSAKKIRSSTASGVGLGIGLDSSRA